MNKQEQKDLYMYLMIMFMFFVIFFLTVECINSKKDQSQLGWKVPIEKK